MSAPGGAAAGGMAAGMGAAIGLGMAQQVGPWGAPPAPPATPAPPVWRIAGNGSPTGPFDTDTLTQTAANLVWTAGQDGWQAAGTTALASLLNQTPPPPPAG